METITETPTTETVETTPSTPTEESTVAKEPIKEPVKEPVKEDKLHRAFAQISRKEKQLVAKEQQLKARIAELEKAAQVAQEYNELRESFKKDPLNNIKKLGMSFEDMVKFSINEDRPPLESKLEALERKLAEREQAEQEAQNRAREQFEKQQRDQAFQSDIEVLNGFLQAHADSYELSIMSNNSRMEILDVFYGVVQQYQEQGIDLDPKETEDLLRRTCDEYENVQQEKLEKHLSALRSTKKFSNRFTSIPKTEKPNTVSTTDTQIPETKKTLTSNLIRSGVVNRTINTVFDENDSINQATALLRKMNRDREESK